MSEIASQFAAGVSQAMELLGTTGTYTRVDTKDSITVSVSLSEPDYLIANDGGAVLLPSDQWDIVVQTAELAFSGVSYEPQTGDTVAVTSEGKTRTYLVAPREGVEGGRRFCWKWADRFMVRRRLLTKLIAISVPM